MFNFSWVKFFLVSASLIASGGIVGSSYFLNSNSQDLKTFHHQVEKEIKKELKVVNDNEEIEEKYMPKNQNNQSCKSLKDEKNDTTIFLGCFGSDSTINIENKVEAVY